MILAIRISAEATREAEPKSSNAGVIIAAIVATATNCVPESPTIFEVLRL
jgi:hypothetical protein